MALGFAPPELEQAVLNAGAATRLGFQMAAKQVNPNVAQLLTKWANYAPYLSPKIAVPLAHQGIDPDSELGQIVVKNHYGLFNPTLPSNQQVDGPMAGLTGRASFTPAQDISQYPYNNAPFTAPQRPQHKESGFSLGGIGSALGDIASGVGDVVSGARNEYDKLTNNTNQALNAGGVPDVQPTAKGAIRTGMEVLQAPYEAEQNFAGMGASTVPVGAPGIGPRDYAGPAGSIGGQNFTPSGLLDVGKATTLWQDIQGANAGNGFLPSGDAVQRAQALQREIRGTIDGHAYTPGRYLASEIVEPGSKPYTALSGLVDVMLAYKTDPAAIALSSVTDAREAQQAYNVWGVAKGGFRATVDPERLRTALDSPQAQATFQNLANLRSTRMARAVSKDQWSWDIAAKVADARTPDEVRAILEPEMAGKSVGQLAQMAGPGFGWSSPLANARWAQLMPGPVLDVTDPNQRTENFVRWLVNGKVDPGSVDRLAHDMALAGDNTDVFQVWKRGADEVAKQSLLGALPPVSKEAATTAVKVSIAKELERNPDFVVPSEDEMNALIDQARLPYKVASYMTRAFHADTEAARILHVDAMNQPLTLDGLLVDGEPIKLFGPQRPSELLNSAIPLPDAREIRKTISTWRKTLSNQTIQDMPMVGSGARGLMNATEILGNAALAGTNIWRIGVHMRGALTARILIGGQGRMAAGGNDSIFTHPIDYIRAVLAHKGDAMGIPFDALADEGGSKFVQAMGPGYRSIAPGADGLDRAVLQDYQTYARGQEGFGKWWADELTGVYKDPVMRQVAQAVHQGQGLDALKDAYWEDKAGWRRMLARAGGDNGWQGILNTREGADKYIDTQAQWVHDLTGGQADLLDAVANGNFGRNQAWKTSKSFRNTLDAYAEQGIGPDYVRGLGPARDIKNGHGMMRAGAALDKAANNMFKWLITVPSVKLMRHPVFNENYWGNMARAWPSLDDAARAEIRSQIADPNGPFIPKKFLADFASNPAAGEVPLEHADAIAKTAALNETNRLLYNFADKNQMADAFKIVAPFGDLWKKELTGWARVVADNPQVVRRVQQGIQGARGSGFFYTDPTDGQEYFTVVPAFVTNAVAGVPFPLRAQVKGLNILGQGLPGVGPAIQIPASHLIPDTPAYNTIRNQIMPFGDRGFADGLVEAMMPGWMQRLRENGWLAHTGLFNPSPNQTRVFEDSQKTIMAYLQSTGHYDMSTPEGLAKLVSDAKWKAEKLYAIRSAAQFLSPAAPQALPEVKTKDGTLEQFYVLAKDYRNMEQADPNNAAADFIAKYGAGALLSTQPFGQRIIYGAPTTREMVWWASKNQKFASTFKDVYGYFGPQDGNFDYNAYLSAIRRGEITALTPRQWLEQAEQRSAGQIYSTQRAKFGPNPTQAQLDWLSGLRSALMQDHPGYDPLGSNKAQHSTGFLIDELGKAAQDKSMSANPVAEATNIYLTKRQQVLDEIHAAAGPRASLSRKEYSNVRTWLRGLGTALAQDYPAFQPVWDDILYHEVPVENESVSATAALAQAATP